mgnify:CR=1 FL=1|tara:strand:+ start:19739 stop:21358 length:1620 start_codon:yes stop_codon:yes gene_type:complete
MSEVTGTVWRVEFGEISEREQFRVGYINQATYEGYFPISQLTDLIAVLNGIPALGLNVLSIGTGVQARKVATGGQTFVVIEPRSDQFPPQIMRFELSLLSDLVATLTALQSALSDPGDWDDSKPGKITEAMLPPYLGQQALTATIVAVSGVAKGIYIPHGWGQFWRPKLAAAKAGTGKCTLGIAGDSISEGYIASNLDLTSWAGRVATELQSDGADGGSGFHSLSRSTVFAASGARGASIGAAQISAYQANGNYWTISGTWTEYVSSGIGPGSYAARTIVAASYAQRTVRGSTITIYTTSNAGGNAGFTYSIDGGSAVAVADGAGFAVQRTVITGLSSGTHTVRITYNGDGIKALILLGVSAENATGVVVNNFSQYGQYSNTFLNDSGLKPGSWSGGSNYPADLVIYSMGLNDAVANITPDTYSKNIRKYLDGVRDGITGKIANGATDVLFLVQHAGNYDPTNLIYQDYAIRRRGIAETYGCAIVDMWADGRNSWNYWNSLGYWGNGGNPGAQGTDAVHLSDAGMQHVADTLLPYLLAT